MTFITMMWLWFTIGSSFDISRKCPSTRHGRLQHQVLVVVFKWNSKQRWHNENPLPPPPQQIKTLWGNQCDKHGTKKKNRLFKPQTSSTSICFSNKNTPQTPSCWNYCLLILVGNDLPTIFMEWDSPSIINIFYASKRCLYFLKINTHAFHAFWYYFIPLLLAFHVFPETKCMFDMSMIPMSMMDLPVSVNHNHQIFYLHDFLNIFLKMLLS